MSKYAKLENGRLIFPAKPLKIENNTTYNPTEVQLFAAGFKEYIIQKEPPAQQKWHYLTPAYIETETQIIQKWTQVKQPSPIYKQLVVQKITERYDHDDEISLIQKNTTDPDYIEYRKYVQECKEWANEQIEEYNGIKTENDV